jgi:hypothetical protein
VDQLFIAGHRAATPQARPLLADLGLPNFGVLIDLRKLLLAPSGMELWQAEALERYQDPRGIDKALEAHVEQRLVLRTGNHFAPSAPGRTLLLRLTDLLSAAVEDIWGEEPACASAARTAHALVDSARTRLSEADYPAFASESRGYMPDAAPSSMQLWSALASLRYLRADAHALAWAGEGLSAREIAILSALCEDVGVFDVTTLPGATYGGVEGVMRALNSLALRGWASESEGTAGATNEGREVRRRVEERTNEHNAPAYTALTDREREAFLSTLRALPPEAM